MGIKKADSQQTWRTGRSSVLKKKNPKTNLEGKSFVEDLSIIERYCVKATTANYISADKIWEE